MQSLSEYQHFLRNLICIHLKHFPVSLWTKKIDGLWNAILKEAQTGIKIVQKNINNLRYTDDITLTAERKEELKSLLVKVKEESEKAGLNLNIQKTKIMAFSPITLWQIDGEKKWKQWETLFSWAPISLQTVTAAMKLKEACTLEGKLWQT